MWTASHSGFLKLKFPCLFCRIGIFWSWLALPVSTPKKTKLPRAARLCLSLSKLKLYINQFKKSPAIPKKKQNASTFYVLDFSPVRWSRIGTKFLRPFDALPVPRLVRRQCQSPQWHPKSITDWWSILEFGIPTFPLICLICFYMFANSLLYCHLVCKVHYKPTATPFFCRKWSNGVFQSVRLRWWVFVLPGPVSRQNSSMCQGHEIRNGKTFPNEDVVGWCGWLERFWLGKIDEILVGPSFSNLRFLLCSNFLCSESRLSWQKITQKPLFYHSWWKFTFIGDRLSEHVMIKLRIIHQKGHPWIHESPMYSQPSASNLGDQAGDAERATSWFKKMRAAGFEPDLQVGFVGFVGP